MDMFVITETKVNDLMNNDILFPMAFKYLDKAEMIEKEGRGYLCYLPKMNIMVH